MNTRATLLTGLLSLALMCADARGHAIVVYSGRFALQAGTLRLTLDLDERLLAHEGRAFGQRITGLRLAELLATSIVVFTDQGERPVCSGVTITDDPHRAEIVFDVPAGATAVALMHVPTGALAAQSRQFQLRRMGADPDRSELVRLTSGGNHHVVRVDEDGSARTPGVDEFAEPILRILAAPDGGCRRFEIDFPCMVLDAWPELNLGGPVVANHMLEERAAALGGWFAGNLECRNAGGAIGWQLEGMSLVAPDGKLLGDSASDRGCLLTTRVRFSVSLAPADDGGPMDLVWRGFHQAMMRLAVVVAGDGSAVRPADLTATQNVLRIDGLDVVRTVEDGNMQRKSDKSSVKNGSNE